jgi:hypothetical protein
MHVKGMRDYVSPTKMLHDRITILTEAHLTPDPVSEYHIQFISHNPSSIWKPAHRYPYHLFSYKFPRTSESDDGVYEWVC